MFEFIVKTISDGGYVGIFLLMFIENIFPPIPSELIMPFAGFAAARGDLNIGLVVVIGTAGSVAGAFPWYLAGALMGQERLKRLAVNHGRWLTVSSQDIDTASMWYQRHGLHATLLGRLVPGVRTLISVPAGIMGMPLLPFTAYSAIGSLLWTGLLAAAGFFLESKYEAVAQYLDPVSKIVIGLIVAAYLYRLMRYPAINKK